MGLYKIAKHLLGGNKGQNYQNNLADYADVNEWKLDLYNLNLRYETSDSYSKGWFYPRYDNGKIHEPVATKIFIDHIKRGSEVLDIGGHLGYFSCIAGRLAVDGNVNVFEVDPQCLKLIQRNLDFNHLDNVTVHNCAVSDTPEKVKIPMLENPNPGLIIDSKSDHGHIEVDSITIDDFVVQENMSPDFIKIDVEGAEAKVLNGMKNLLKRNGICILVEVHVKNLKKYFNTDYREIVDLLLNHGFTIENIDHRLNDSTFRPVNRNTVLKGNTMLLCKK